jgi:hypothetical protein
VVGSGVDSALRVVVARFEPKEATIPSTARLFLTKLAAEVVTTGCEALLQIVGTTETAPGKPFVRTKSETPSPVRSTIATPFGS